MKNENKIIKTFFMDKRLLKIINDQYPNVNLSEKLNELIEKGLKYDTKFNKLTQKDVIEWQLRTYYKNNPEAPQFPKF